MDIPMDVYPEPKSHTAAVLIFSGEKEAFNPFVIDHGNDNYVCGKCSAVLCKNIIHGSVKNLVFKCPFCDSYNHLQIF